MATTEYSFDAVALTSFCASDSCTGGDDELCRWAGLVDSIGPSSLPFVIKRPALANIPFAELGIPTIDPAALTPKQGEMWILFCYSEEIRSRFSQDQALRSDGFPLVLEWRKDVQDSANLSPAIIALARLVRKQLGAEGWGLHPAYERYGDKVRFTDPDLFADEVDSKQVASAYGALAAGLACAISGKYPPVWPFPTLQWDGDLGRGAGVAGIEKKISVAADFGAEIITVCRGQERVARKALASLCESSEDGRFRDLRIYGVRDHLKPAEFAKDIGWGAIKKRRRKWAGWIAVALVVALAGVALYAQSVFSKIREDRRVLDDSARTIRSAAATSGERFAAWSKVRDLIRRPEARRILAEEVVKGNWLVPIRISDLPLTNGAPYVSNLFPSRSDTGVIMMWIPCGFAGNCWYTIDKGKVVCEIPKGTVRWRKSGRGWYGVETLRIAPCGLAAIVEVALPTRRLVALDPFDGHELWEHKIDERITAFAFSGDCRRFAFAANSNVYLCDLMTGGLVANPLRFDWVPRAIAFSDGDSQLKVAAYEKEVLCSIFVQLDATRQDVDTCEMLIQDEVSDVLSFFTDVFPSQSEGVGPVTRKSTFLQRVIAAASKHPASRTINLASSKPFSEYASERHSSLPFSVLPSCSNGMSHVQTNRNDQVAVAYKLLSFQPDERVSFMYLWNRRLEQVVLRNVGKEIDINGLSYAVFASLYFALDQQAMQYERALITFANSRFPGDSTVEKHADLYRWWSGVDAKDKCEDHTEHIAPQADNPKAKDEWIDNCRKAESRNNELREGLVGLCEFQTDFAARVVKPAVLQKSSEILKVIDNVVSNSFVKATVAVNMWTAMKLFNENGMTALALASIDSFARVFSDLGGDVKFLAGARQFVKEGVDRRGQKAIVLQWLEKCGPENEAAWLISGDVLVSDESNHDEIRIFRFDEREKRLLEVRKMKSAQLLAILEHEKSRLKQWEIPGFGTKISDGLFKTLLQLRSED